MVFLAMDESTDLSSTLQLLVFIHVLDHRRIGMFAACTEQQPEDIFTGVQKTFSGTASM